MARGRTRTSFDRGKATGKTAAPGRVAGGRAARESTETTSLATSNPQQEKHLQEIQELAHLLDNSFRIPLINYRFGVDAIIGLVPVIGDFTAFGLAGWIIYRAARMGAPKALLARMLANALGDTLVGSVPVLGTLVDVVWKSNSRNLRMLERFLAQDR